MKVKKFLTVIAIIFVLTNLPVTVTLADGYIAYRIFNTASDLAFKEPVTTIIRSQAEWRSFYRNGTADYDPAPRVPKVDFRIYNVVVVATGEKPNSGFATAIVNVYVEASTVRVSALDIKYCSSIGPQVVTYPSIVILVPKTKKQFLFDISSAAVVCN